MAVTALTADLKDTEEILQYILGDAREKYAEVDVELLRRAYEFAREAHAGQRRASGDPYIRHPVEVARILAERRFDAHGLAAALLHDTIEDCSGVQHSRLSQEFGEVV